MALPSFALTSDTELKNAVRDKTSYNDSADEMPATQMDGLLDDAKRVLYMRTESDKWYNDVGYGQALSALTAMKAKAAVENVNIQSYGIGNENVMFSNADPESSQQLTAWSAEINEGIEKSNLNFDKGGSASFSNTSSYIG